MSRTYQSNSSGCPHCGVRQDLYTGTTGEGPPRDGDVTICWRCRGLAMVEVGPLGVTGRPPTAAEHQEITADPRVRRALAAAAESYDPQTAAKLTRGEQ